MRKHLQCALTSAPILALLFFFSQSLLAQSLSGSSDTIAATTDDSGHKVYVNDFVAAPQKSGPAQSSPRSSLAFWSNTEHRWKPVPPANIRAARSAAAEVNKYLGQDSAENAVPLAVSPVRSKVFSPEDVERAIDEAAARHNVDPNLVRSVIKVESNFNPNAVSRKGAMGLMQLMPQTARQLNVVNPFDPAQNVDAGVRHLKKLMESYGGDVKLTLAAYNAGAGAVARSAGIPHFSETRNYVNRITQLYYGGYDVHPGSHLLGAPVHDPVRVQRDARGVLYISNTD